MQETIKITNSGIKLSNVDFSKSNLRHNEPLFIELLQCHKVENYYYHHEITRIKRNNHERDKELIISCSETPTPRQFKCSTWHILLKFKFSETENKTKAEEDSTKVKQKNQVEEKPWNFLTDIKNLTPSKRVKDLQEKRILSLYSWAFFLDCNC